MQKQGAKKAGIRLAALPKPGPARISPNIPSRPRQPSVPEESKSVRSASSTPTMPEPSPVLSDLQERYTALLRVLLYPENSGGTQRNAKIGCDD